MIMTQRIMLRDRKYLHVELIDLRVCRYRGILKSRRNRVESVRLFMTLQLQKYERDYMERYSENISSANETTKNCIRWGAMEGKKEEKDSRRVFISSSTRKEHSVRNGLYPPQSQISLYRSNSVTTSVATIL